MCSARSSLIPASGCRPARSSDSCVRKLDQYHLGGYDALDWRQFRDGCVIFLLTGFLVSDAEIVLFIRQYSLQRTVVRGDPKEKPNKGDIEKGAVEEEEVTNTEPTASTETAIGESDDLTIGEKSFIAQKTIDHPPRDPASTRPTTSSTLAEKDPAV